MVKSVNKQDMFEIKWQPSKEVAPKPVDGYFELSDIQKEGFDLLHKQKNCSIVAPTGCGKSWLICALLAYKLHNNTNLRGIISVPQRNIGVGFKEAKFKLPTGENIDWHPSHFYCNGDDGNVTALINFLKKENDNSISDRVFICTHQTLVIAFAKLKDLNRTDLLENLVVWIDEGHHVSAELVEDDFDSINANRIGDFVIYCLKEINNSSINLATASFFRGDQSSILPAGYENEFVKFSVPIDRYLESMKHLKSLSFNYILSNEPYEKIIERLYKDHVGKSIIYIPHVSSKYTLQNKYTQTKNIIKTIKRGRRLNVVDLVTEIGRDERRELIGDGKNSKIDAIVSLGMFKEGSNWINADRAIVLGPRNSLVEVVQILGRLLRDCPGKSHVEFCMVLPFSLEQSDKEKFRDNLNEFQKSVFLSMLVENIINPVKIQSFEKKEKSKSSKDESTNYSAVDYLSEHIRDESKRLKVFSEISEAARDFSASVEGKSDAISSLKKELPNIVREVLSNNKIKTEHADDISEQMWKIWRRRTLKIKGSEVSDININLIDEIHPLEFMLRYGSGEHGIDTFKDLKLAFARRKDFLPFEEARELARSFNLKSQTEWFDFWKNENDELKNKIPRNPYQTYHEWVSWADWLGYNGRNARKKWEKYLSYEDLKEKVRELNIKSASEYEEKCCQIVGAPSVPYTFYKEEWSGWDDFLGVKKYLSFFELKDIVKKHNLNKMKEYQKIYKSIPGAVRSPDSKYKSEWKGWLDFLGLEEKDRQKTLTCKGKTLTVQQWAKETGIKSTTIYRRLEKGWEAEKALFDGDFKLKKDKEEFKIKTFKKDKK